MICCVMVVLSVGVFVLNDVGNHLESPEYMYELCCNGSICTDTYYDFETNKCVLTMTCGMIGGCKTYEPRQIEVWNH